MRSKPYMLAVFLLGAALALGQSTEHEKAHADHMEHHFDPKESAKSFDDPARDSWQLPDRVIAALHLKPGQIVADIGAHGSICPTAGISRISGFTKWCGGAAA